MTSDRPTVVLALSPPLEQELAPLLFGADAAVTVAASLIELAALDRTLDQLDGEPAALLVSADAADLSPGALARARSRGLLLVGIAADEHDHPALQELALDQILTLPLAVDTLQNATRPATDDTPRALAQPPARRAGSRREREGTVLAVVGCRGAPGASELACSLAALAARQWQTLLVELDLLPGAGLALRLGADPGQGSLLALVRATRSEERALGELLDRWLLDQPGWPPVLLAPPDPAAAIAELDQPGAIRTALDALADHFPLVVAEVGALLDQPGPTGPLERCHREAVLAADAVLLVLGAREAQLDAGLAQLDLLLETLAIPRERIRVVCNGVAGPGAVPRTQLEQTLTVGLRERELAADALIPWDARALGKAVATGLPLAAARPRGSYARTLAQLLDSLFLPDAPIARRRKRLLTLPTRTGEPDRQAVVAEEKEEEVALPWRS